MDRNALIYRLEKKLDYYNQQLIYEYKASTLASFLKIEKEIQIQKSYVAHEGV